MSKVGFIGLGCMGQYMANNLIKNGVELTVFDINSTIIKQFASKGANAATSPADVAVQCNRIITMLPEGRDIYSTYTQKKGILE